MKYATFLLLLTLAATSCKKNPKTTTIPKLTVKFTQIPACPNQAMVQYGTWFIAMQNLVKDTIRVIENPNQYDSIDCWMYSDCVGMRMIVDLDGKVLTDTALKQKFNTIHYIYKK